MSTEEPSTHYASPVPPYDSSIGSPKAPQQQSSNLWSAHCSTTRIDSVVHFNALAGMRSARRGVYRIIYEIEETERLVVVYRIEHRATAYRPR